MKQDYKSMHKSNQSAMPSVWLSLAAGIGGWLVCGAIAFGIGYYAMMVEVGAA